MTFTELNDPDKIQKLDAFQERLYNFVSVYKNCIPVL